MLAKSEKSTSRSRIQTKNSLLSINKKEYPLNAESQQKITAFLQQQLNVLISRREKQQSKKHKLEQIELDYQKQRESRVQKMSNKISHSEVVRQQSLKEKLIKNRRNLDNFQKVHKRAVHENEEEIDKCYELRQQFQPKDGSQSRLRQKGSQDVFKKSISDNKNKSMREDQSDFQIKKIEEKIDRAQTNHYFYQQRIRDKLKDQSKNIGEIQQRVRAKSMMHEHSTFNDYYHRATYMLERQKIVKESFAKETQQKKKSFNEKFSKCQNKLKNIEHEREQKYEELKTKFDKKFKPKTWKDQKHEIYLDKFFKNMKEICEEKREKADEILKKHLEITLTNKVVKEKRDKFIQSFKRVE